MKVNNSTNSIFRCSQLRRYCSMKNQTCLASFIKRNWNPPGVSGVVDFHFPTKHVNNLTLDGRYEWYINTDNTWGSLGWFTRGRGSLEGSTPPDGNRSHFWFQWRRSTKQEQRIFTGRDKLPSHSLYEFSAHYKHTQSLLTDSLQIPYSRQSIHEALVNSITSEQIICFLRANAHPSMLRKSPVIPATVEHQIVLWEKERDRLSCNEGVLYNHFDTPQDFEILKNYAEMIGVLIWASSTSKTMVVTKDGHDDVRRYWKRNKPH